MAKVPENEEEVLELELEPLESEKPEPEIQIEKTEEPIKAVEKTRDDRISVDDGIRDLKMKLEEEKLARLDAERRVKQASEQANMARSEVDDTNLKLIDSAIDTVKNNETLLKQRYKESLVNQDYDEVAEIQSQMADIALQKMQLLNGKFAYETKMKEPKYQQPVESDPVEQLANQLSSRSAEWVRSHPEFATNPRLYQKMIAAHNLAIADGVEADTDDYFDTIEYTLKVRPQNSVEAPESALSTASAPLSRRSAPPAAPPSRSPSTNSGTRPNVVRLNASEREMANMMGMTDQEYAKNKMALIKEGKLN